MIAAVGPAAPVEDRRQAVFVAWDPSSKTCGARVGSAETGDLGTAAGKAALIRALPDKSQWIHIMGTQDAPYACVSAVVDALRGDGYTRIGFIAEPEPASGR